MHATILSRELHRRNRFFSVVLLLIVTALLSFSVVFDNLPIGAPMPKGDVKLMDITGQEITLKSAAKENGLLVMFSCNTCPVVIKNQSRAKEICEYSLNQNIGVVVLNSNEANRSD